MIPKGEIELDMVQRHIREGEARVACQRELLARLLPDSDRAKTAHQLLGIFERILERRRQHLARLLG